MFALPHELQLYNNTSYTDIFLLTVLWNIGIFGMPIFAMFIILLSIKIYKIRSQKFDNMKRDSLITRESQNISQPESSQEKVLINHNQQDNIEKNKNGRKCTLFDVINICTSLFFYATLICISLICLAFYSFGKYGHGTGHDIIAISLLSTVIIVPTFLWKRATSTKLSKLQPKHKKQLIFTLIMFVFWIGVCTFAVLATKGVCHCIFNDRYGFIVQGDYRMSTEFTRSLQINKVCPDGEVCHLYATLAENASNSVFINVHTGIDILNLTVLLQNNNSSLQNNNYGNDHDNIFTLMNNRPFKMHDYEQIGKRNVFSFYFNNLKPNTLYDLTVKDTTNQRILKKSNYLTLPNQDAQQLRLAVGGDVGIDDQAYKITSYLVQYNPHAIILGGDNAYDDGFRTCFYSWDSLYNLFEMLNEKLNRVVPIIFTVGNHDVGYHAMAQVQINFNNIQQVPYYFIFNPQHTLLNRNQVPDIKERLTYHYHVLGPTVHVHLDSGYVANYNTQNLFLSKIISNFPNHYKFANYHNPIYPSCTDSREGSNDRLMIELGLKNWAPLFDSGKFVAAFEHHTHHKKITYKIQADKVNKSDGVRYVGDGSWGVPQNQCAAERGTPRPQYFQYFDKEHPNHIWKVRIIKNANQNYSIKYQAININNTVDFSITDDLN